MSLVVCLRKGLLCSPEKPSSYLVLATKMYVAPSRFSHVKFFFPNM